MLSKELETVLNDAFRTARSRRHEFITVEHLLLALLEDAASLTRNGRLWRRHRRVARRPR